MPYSKAPSAKVLANRAAKVVLNRAAFDQITLAVADGLYELGLKVIADAAAKAPRDPEKAAERGVPMMADTGHVVAFVNGKRIAGDVGRKPRGAKVGPGISIIAGFGSPLAHLIEGGTIKMRARPFLTPAMMADLPGAEGFMKAACVKHQVIKAARAAQGVRWAVRT